MAPGRARCRWRAGHRWRRHPRGHVAVENIGVRDWLKRSFELFKQTWGEGFVGSTAIGGISCLVTLAVLLFGGGIIVAGVLTGALALVILGAVLLILGLVVVSLLNGAANGIFQASMYHYATTGDGGPFIDDELAREAFRSWAKAWVLGCPSHHSIIMMRRCLLRGVFFFGGIQPDSRCSAGENLLDYHRGAWGAWHFKP